MCDSDGGLALSLLLFGLRSSVRSASGPEEGEDEEDEEKEERGLEALLAQAEAANEDDVDGKENNVTVHSSAVAAHKVENKYAHTHTHTRSFDSALVCVSLHFRRAPWPTQTPASMATPPPATKLRPNRTAPADGKKETPAFLICKSSTAFSGTGVPCVHGCKGYCSSRLPSGTALSSADKP